MCGMLLGVGGSPLAQRTTSLYLFFFGNIWSEIPQSVQLGHPGQCFSQPHQNIHENVGMKLFRFKISGGEEVTFSLHSWRDLYSLWFLYCTSFEIKTPNCKCIGFPFSEKLVDCISLKAEDLETAASEMQWVTSWPIARPWDRSKWPFSLPRCTSFKPLLNLLPASRPLLTCNCKPNMYVYIFAVAPSWVSGGGTMLMTPHSCSCHATQADNAGWCSFQVVSSCCNPKS